MSDLLADTIALRARAWDAVKSSPAYAQFCALDEAVIAMGGTSMTTSHSPTHSNLVIHAVRRTGANYIGMGSTHFSSGAKYPAQERKISHADAALSALRKAGRPMLSPELLAAARAEGAAIGGEKPIINLTSSLSRSGQIESRRINGVPHWWIVGVPLPEGYSASDLEEEDNQDHFVKSEREADDDATVNNFDL